MSQLLPDTIGVAAVIGFYAKKLGTASFDILGRHLSRKESAPCRSPLVSVRNTFFTALWGAIKSLLAGTLSRVQIGSVVFGRWLPGLREPERKNLHLFFSPGRKASAHSLF
jgi:hypothetical protein